MKNKERLFAAPRIHGARFEREDDQASMPVEVLPELAAYRELIVQVAKELYRQRTGIKNVPKRFVEGFKLRLTSIAKGSSAPQIVRDLGPGADAVPSEEEWADDYEESRDLVGEAIDVFSNQGSIPQAFPKKALPYFRSFGKTMQADEYWELPTRRRPNMVAYTPDVRKRLVLLSFNTYEQDVRLTGRVVGFESEPKRVFTIRDETHGLAVVPFAQHQEQDLVIAWRDRKFTTVDVVGTGLFNRKDELQNIEDVSSVTLVTTLEEERVAPIETRIGTFEKLEGGWFDGEGLPPSRDGLAWLRTLLLGLIAERSLPLPELFPLEHGGVQAEWHLNGWAVTAEFDLNEKSAHLHASDVGPQRAPWRAEDIDFQVGDNEANEERLVQFVMQFGGIGEPSSEGT